MRTVHTAHDLLHAAALEVLDQAPRDRVIVLIARNVLRLAGELSEQWQALPDGVG